MSDAALLQYTVREEDAPTDVEVESRPLTPEQRAWVEDACAQIDRDALLDLCANLVDIASPTGEESALARFMADWMCAAGLDGIHQPIDERQANAVGRMRGTGAGPSLMLYSHISAGRPGELARAVRHPGGFVSGPGAHNPKGYATCVMAAAAAIRAANIPLHGDLLVGLGSGGSPSNRPDDVERYNVGHGVGCSFMLEQGFYPDYAIIAKPGWAVAWEEVGLSWFRVTIHGDAGYVGARQWGMDNNPIVHSAQVIDGLEQWFREYAKRHTSGLVIPQGSIGAIRGGYPWYASITPATCELLMDVRLSPRTSPTQVRREFLAGVRDIQAALPAGVRLEADMVVAIPGSYTPPDNWVVQSTMRAWQWVEDGAPHQPLTDTSGATDANILRNRGVPTARIGFPFVPESRRRPLPLAHDFNAAMGVADVEDMERLVRALIYAAIDTCTRTDADIHP